MALSLKPLDQQTIVISGGSSGIGLATAKLAVARGARVVLAARNEDSLANAVAQLNAERGAAVPVAADVASEEDVRRIAEIAASAFGGFDTWVNNAAVALYGRLTEVSLADQRRLFDVNFWGVVNGSRVAVEHLRGRAGGGALVNVGSILSDRAMPLQGTYSAAKHAVKGFTDALRMEVEKDDLPISVTLVKPAAIDTPYYRHAKNYMDEEPKPPAPVYAPEVVARAILRAATTPVRDVIIGGGGKAISALGVHAPRFTDRFMEATQFDAQRAERPTADRGDRSLYRGADPEASVRGGYDGHVAESSAYTAAALHPRVTALAAFGVGLALVAGYRALRSDRPA
jgi:short-subunit dehydrogenase